MPFDSTCVVSVEARVVTRRAAVVCPIASVSLPGDKRLLFILGVTLLAATSAYAQSGWSGVVTNLSPPRGEVDSLRVEMDADGNAFAVWSAGSAVWVARREASVRRWSGAVSLIDGGTSRVRDLDLFVDRGGNAAAVWIRTGPGGGAGTIEYARYFADDGAWSNRAVVPG